MKRVTSLSDLIYRPLFFAVLALIAAVSVFFRVRPFSGERETVTIQADNGTFPCDRGIYSFHVRYDADDTIVTPVFTRDENENIVMLSNGNYLLASCTSADIRLYVKEDNTTGQFYMHEMFENSNGRIHQVDVIYRPLMTVTYYALRTLVPFLVLCGILLFGRLFFRASQETKRIILSLCGIIFFISLPLFVEYIIGDQDYVFHLNRIAAIGEGIFSGSFPVRLYPVYFHNYGYPPGVMYGDLFLYAPALLYMLGVPLWRCYQLFLLCVNIALVLSSWYVFKRISGNSLTGVCGSAMYSASMYALINLYYRSAVGEYCAMVFLPLVLLGFWLLFGPRPKEAAAYLILGFTGLIQTHTLSTVMAFVFGVLLCLVCIRSLLREKRLPVLLASGGIAFLLNAGFLLPFLDYFTKCDFVMKHMYQMDPANGASIPQLFMLEYAPTGGTFSNDLSLANEMPATPGLAIMLLLIITACFLLLTQKSAQFKPVYIGFGFAMLALFMSTRLFPYAFLERTIPPLYDIIGRNVQFPVRYLVIVIPLVCMLSVLVYNECRKRFPGALPVVVMAGLIIISLWQGLTFMSRRLNTAEARQPLSAAELGNYGDILYLLSDVEAGKSTADQALHLSSEALSLREVSRAASHFRFAFHVTNDGAREGWIDLPVWNYPHYVAETSDGERLEISDGENRCIRVTVPASFDADVTVGFREPLYWRAAEIISVLTACVLLYVWKRQHRRTAWHRRRVV